MILQTEALILQTRRFRESSMIVTFFSRDRGKMSVVARGAVQMKSKFRAVLHPMAYVSVVVYMKEGRELQNLSSAEPVERFPHLMSSLERMSVGLSILELVNASVQPDDPNELLFNSMVGAFRALDQEVVDEASVGLWFMVRLARLLGYAVRTDECGVCEEPITAGQPNIPYSLSIGAPLCAEHRESSAYRMLSSDAFRLLGALRTIGSKEAGAIIPSRRTAAELNDAMTSFIRFHVEGMRRLKVAQVTSKVLDGAIGPSGRE